MGADSNPHWYKFYQKIYILWQNDYKKYGKTPSKN